MNESKNLTVQELTHIKDCREEGYPDPDDDMSRVLAIRDVARLLAHIDALEAEHAALMTRAMKDADRLGNAYIEFTNQQTARIEVLEMAIRDTIEMLPGVPFADRGEAEQDVINAVIRLRHVFPAE